MRYLCYMLLFFTCTALHAQTRVYVDKKTISQAEVFQLNVETDQDKLDPTPLLKDFEIVSQGQSRKFQIINGVSSNITVFQFHLQAKNSGKLRIPPLQVGIDKTQALTINVSAAKQQLNTGNRIADIQLLADRNTAYVNEQILLTIRISHNLPIIGASLGELKADNLQIERLGDDNNYKAQFKGKNVDVFERRFVVTANKSGKVTIPGVSFRAQTQQVSAPNPFSRDPFGNFFSQGRVENVLIKSNSLSLTIKTENPKSTANWWAPGENLKLKVTATPKGGDIALGEPLSLHIMVEGDRIKAEQLPAPAIASIDGLDVFEEKPDLSNKAMHFGFRGRLEKTITLVPQSPGLLELPSVSIKYWDTAQDKELTLNSDALSYNVYKKASNNILSTASEDQSPQDNLQQQGDTIEQISAQSYWVYALLILSLLINAVLIFKPLWKTDRQNTPSAVPSTPMQLNELRKAVKNDDPREFWAVLKKVVQHKYGSGVSIEQFSETNLDDKAKELLEQLQRQLFRGDGHWQREELWDALYPVLKSSPSTKQHDGVLDTLYPI